ncbi:outer membrane transport energization protein TonB [Thalassolituus maritimus]|uniref:Outer membrane transport energization protein TonB n=1 Tax=Thalassolituus maritimus TaxID=484498 RepID=A0A1N7IX71_9GAMM|nr:energy transducer TonB [Thalassolituus maritimus]SIS41591.1 outer membrane transport energization protein TonB [Thalassolituus maritimus]
MMKLQQSIGSLFAGVHWRRQALASATGALVLLVTLAILLIGQRLPELAEPTLEVRNINIALPPPPPPPPQPVTQPQVDIPLDVSAAGAGPSIPDIEVPAEITLAKPDAPRIETQSPVFDTMAPDLDVFNLDELDGLPKLLTRPSITFPSSLRRRGIIEVSLKLEVTIDEGGRLTLNRIVENPYPELNNEINRLIKRSRFTPPNKGGQKVRARFIWPIDIKS